MNVIDITDATFDAQVWKSSAIDKGGAVVVVEFSDGVKAPEGGSKKSSERMSDLMNEVATEYGEKVGLKMFRMNYKTNPDIAQRYDIQSAPTLLLLQVEELVGNPGKDALKAKIDKKLS
ncbi:MAG: Thioredoxin [Pseudomonas sp.]|nr:Thioredoxin [Pseudomonas sp.]